MRSPSSVLPVPGGPDSSTPLGILAPSRANLLLFFRHATHCNVGQAGEQARRIGTQRFAQVHHHFFISSRPEPQHGLSLSASNQLPTSASSRLALSMPATSAKVVVGTSLPFRLGLRFLRAMESMEQDWGQSEGGSNIAAKSGSRGLEEERIS